jgi:hypothetical protein
MLILFSVNLFELKKKLALASYSVQASAKVTTCESSWCLLIRQIPDQAARPNLVHNNI